MKTTHWIWTEFTSNFGSPASHTKPLGWLLQFLIRSEATLTEGGQAHTSQTLTPWNTLWARCSVRWHRAVNAEHMKVLMLGEANCSPEPSPHQHWTPSAHKAVPLCAPPWSCSQRSLSSLLYTSFPPKVWRKKALTLRHSLLSGDRREWGWV